MSFENPKKIKHAKFQSLKKTKSLREIGKRGRHGVICRVNSPKSSYMLHRHDYVEIEYLVSGRLEHELNGCKTNFGPGDCWCLDSYDLHMFTVTEPVKIHNICIDVSTVSDAVTELLGSIPFPLTGHMSDEVLTKVVSLFEKLYTVSLEETAYAGERATAYLLLILVHIFENSEHQLDKPAPAGYKHVARAIEYISAHYYEPLTLGGVAAEVHLSPNYFSKLFCEVSGKTFIDYLTYIRINRAKELLSGTDVSVTAAALDSGFGSFSSFSRTFIKHVGCTPTEYRKRARERYFTSLPDDSAERS